MELFTYAERPDLSERLGEVEDTLKPFLGHGNVALEHWHKLRPEHPELQLVLYDDENDVVVGHARTLPTREADGLPNGIDGVLELWFVRNPDASLVRYQVPEVPGTDPRSWVPGSCAAP